MCIEALLNISILAFSFYISHSALVFVPISYVLANTFKMIPTRDGKKLREKIYTTGKTRTIAGNTSPVWEQDLRVIHL